MRGRRIRLTVLADELRIDFYDLFVQVCRTVPKAIDDRLTVSEPFAEFLRDYRDLSAVA